MTTPSLYKRMMDYYFKWYKEAEDVPPRVNAAEGKALKEIIKYLLGLTDSDEERAFEGWIYILKGWPRLDDFYQKQKDLKQINSNINALIRQIKKSSKSAPGQRGAAHRNAADYRSRF